MKRRDDDFVKKIKTTSNSPLSSSSSFYLDAAAQNEDQEDQTVKVVKAEKQGKLAALPILNSEGNWKMVRKVTGDNDDDVNDSDSDASSGSSSEDEDEEIEENTAITLQKAKDVMAEISISILEGGGAVMFQDRKLTTQSQKLKLLLSFCDWKRKGGSVGVAKVALISLVAIFKDILPSYSIKTIANEDGSGSGSGSGANGGGPLSRDIKDQREGEQGLLEMYEAYLKIIMTNIGYSTTANSTSSHHSTKSFQGRRGRSHEANDSPAKMSFLLRKAHTRPIVDCSVSCLAQLVECATHFNHYQSKVLPASFFVLSLSAKQALATSLRERIAVSLATRISLGAKESGDGRGDERVLWIMRGLGDLVNEWSYTSIPTCWLSIPKAISFNKPSSAAMATVPGTAAAMAKKKRKQHMSAKEKKEHKAKQQQLATLALAEGAVKEEEVKKWHSESLRQLFRIYFGILRKLKIDICGDCDGSSGNNGSVGGSTAEDEEMLGLVLDGLSRHAHRIGVEYYVDLMSVLKGILLDSSKDGNCNGNGGLSLLSALQCINVTDRIHSLNEALSAMDLKFLYNALYIQLWRLKPTTKGLVPKIPEQIKDSIRHCMRSFFGIKRQVGVGRVVAFAQRLADLSLLLCCTSCTSGTGGAVTASAAPLEAASFFLLLLKDLLSSQGRACDAALDEETCGQGAYWADAVDPDLCNPLSRSLLEPLKKIGLIVNGWKRVGESGEQIEIRERLFSILKMAK